MAKTRRQSANAPATTASSGPVLPPSRVEHRVVDVSALTPHPRNYRRHPEQQIGRLAASVARFGQVRSIVVQEGAGGRYLIVAGHGLVEAAKGQGLTDLRADVIPADWTPQQVEGYLIADNETARLADDDLTALAEMLTEQANAGFDLESVGMSRDELDDLLTQLAEDALKGAKRDVDDPDGGGDDFDTTPDEEGPTRCQPGDLWQLGAHRLWCGDSTDEHDVRALLDGETVDCVFTSPPYAVGVDYGDTYEDTLENLRAMLPQLSRLWLDAVTPGGFAVVNFGDVASGRNITGSVEPCEYPMALEYWPIFRADGWLLWSRRIWCKPNPRVNSMWCIGSNRAASDWEHIWTWRKPGDPIVKRVDGALRSPLGWIDTTRDEGVAVGKDTHGAGMAVSIAAHMLNVHSRSGAAILEPFMGTGTTMVAAERLSRRCYGMEISPRYCDVILRRWEAETGQEAVLLKRQAEAVEREEATHGAA